jgi:hypothetical protein
MNTVTTAVTAVTAFTARGPARKAAFPPSLRLRRCTRCVRIHSSPCSHCSCHRSCAKKAHAGARAVTCDTAVTVVITAVASFTGARPTCASEGAWRVDSKCVPARTHEPVTEIAAVITAVSVVINTVTTAVTAVTALTARGPARKAEFPPSFSFAQVHPLRAHSQQSLQSLQLPQKSCDEGAHSLARG